MKITNATGVILVLFISALALSSCNPGYGCLINDSAHVKMGKDGKLPQRGGTSSLFPKGMDKKRKKKR